MGFGVWGSGSQDLFLQLKTFENFYVGYILWLPGVILTVANSP